MSGCVATVGTFDGLHVGHMALIGKVREIAAEKGLPTRLITFARHPLSVVNPAKAPKWTADRQAMLAELGRHFDEVVVMDFNKTTAALTARQFMELARDRYGVDTLVMGYDNTFGSDRLASRARYEEAAREAGISIVFAPPVMVDGEPASSSRLRKAIARWDFPLISKLYDRLPRVTAVVHCGKRLGRRLGFPTMNVSLPDDVVPLPDGVYSARVFLEPESSDGLPAVMSVGNNPTVGGEGKTYEIHVIGKDLGDMYGRPVTFTVLEKLRDMEKFATVDDLKSAISADIKRVLK